MSNLETIRVACIKADPSILDLEFGCEVKLKRNLHTRFKGERGMIAGTPEGYAIAFENGHLMMTEDGEDDIEVLGRPIRLADVLLAIGSTEYGIDATGHFLKDFCEKSAWDDKGEIPFKWNLKQDDLEKQSKECLAFIASLL